VHNIIIRRELQRERERESEAEETARVSNGNTGLEIFAVTNLIIIVDLGPAISSRHSGDSEQRTSNSVDGLLVTH
jgi:hypothetical protein